METRVNNNMKFTLYIRLDGEQYQIVAEGSELTWTLFSHKDWDTVKAQRDYFKTLFGVDACYLHVGPYADANPQK